MATLVHANLGFLDPVSIDNGGLFPCKKILLHTSLSDPSSNHIIHIRLHL